MRRYTAVIFCVMCGRELRTVETATPIEDDKRLVANWATNTMREAAIAHEDHVTGGHLQVEWFPSPSN